MELSQETWRRNRALKRADHFFNDQHLFDMEVRFFSEIMAPLKNLEVPEHLSIENHILNRETTSDLHQQCDLATGTWPCD